MVEFVTVEPAHKQRPAFALWALSQSPVINTSSASGFDVPVTLYPDVPSELLDGAYVDGYLYNRVSPQPAVVEPVVTPSEPVAPASSEPPVAAAQAEPASRKRNTRARKAPQE